MSIMCVCVYIFRKDVIMHTKHEFMNKIKYIKCIRVTRRNLSTIFFFYLHHIVSNCKDNKDNNNNNDENIIPLSQKEKEIDVGTAATYTRSPYLISHSIRYFSYKPSYRTQYFV